MVMDRERFREKEIDKAKKQILSELQKQFNIRKSQGTVLSRSFSKYKKTDAYRVEYAAACADSAKLKSLSNIDSAEFEALYQTYIRDVEAKNRKIDQIAEAGSQILTEFQLYLSTHPYQEEYKKMVDPYRSLEECKKWICKFTATEEDLFEFFDVDWIEDDYYEDDFEEDDSEQEEESFQKERYREILWECLLEFDKWDSTFDIFMEHLEEEISDRKEDTGNCIVKSFLTGKDLSGFNNSERPHLIKRLKAQIVFQCQSIPVEDLRQMYREFIFSLESVSDFITSYQALHSISFQDVLRERREKEEAKRQKQIEEKQLERELLENLQQMILENQLDMPELYYPMTRQMKRHFILHIGPTNSGKTHDAIEAMKHAAAGIYLAPLRLMAHEIYDLLTENGIPCSLRTGEERIETAGARHFSRTVELSFCDETVYDVAVIDEGQMLSDVWRGSAWTHAILGIRAKEIHICASEDALDILQKLIELVGDTFEVRMHERKVPLVFQSKRFSFPNSIEEGDALILFSRKNVLTCASVLKDKGIPCSVIYGALPYDVRKEEVRRFRTGETKCIVATDAIGMGLNLPIRRVVFLETEKYDGIKRRPLSGNEVKQIAGRAGRFGKYDKGYFCAENTGAYVNRMYGSSYQPIEKVCIHFPEVLLYAEGKASMLIRKWKKLEFMHELFIKADCTDLVQKCECLEQITEDGDKFSIFAHAMIAFDFKNDDLRAIWKIAYLDMLESRKVDFSRWYDLDVDERMELDQLEELYKKLDLIGSIALREKNAEEEIRWTHRKKLCSEEITRELHHQNKYRGKKCVDCGRKLPWNTTFRYCEGCYQKRRYRYWDDDWDYIY